VLLSHKGNGIDEIACALSVDHQVVRRWLKRYLAQGFDGLRDRPKTGLLPRLVADSRSACA
jgi:transposase